MAGKSKVRSGERYGRLTLVSFHDKRPSGIRWLARCDCGNERIVFVSAARSGNSTSCGCAKVEKLSARMTKHGASATTQYRHWLEMRDRCQNPNNDKYHWYGARGITVCQRWDDFQAFVADMGPRPSGLTLERLDNGIGYQPDNCVWATRAEQSRNRRSCLYVEIEGRRQTLAEACRHLGMNYVRVNQRRRRLHLTAPEIISLYQQENTFGRSAP